MISERTLRKWRGNALKDISNPSVLATNDGVSADFHAEEVKELNTRILKLTQELLDQHLVRKS